MKITESWSIPKMRIYPELYDDVKKLYGKFGQDEVAQEDVAQLWGHKSAKSSQFRVTKLGSLRSYGLIEGRGKVKVSNLGKRLTYPEDEEKLMKAIVEAVKNIPLWKIFFDTFTAKGEDLPKDTLWMNLRQIVGEDKLPPEEAKNKAKILRKAYFEDIKYYKPEFKPKKEEDEMKADKVDKDMAISKGLEEFKFGSVKIFLPKEKTIDAWKKTKKMMDIYLGIEEED